jgi:hypothetical protein
MKKRIFGFGTALMISGILAGCGDEVEEAAAQKEAEESEEVAEVETGETETETAAEPTEEETEEPAEEVEGSATLKKLNDELKNDPEIGEDVTRVYGYNETPETFQLDTLNVTYNMAVLYGMENSEATDWYFGTEGYNIGDEIQMITLEYTIENTVDEKRDFYLDQTTIVTSEGNQIESAFMLSNGLQSEMLGAVKSTGTIQFILPNNNAEEIEWIDVIIPSVTNENWDTLTEETKQRIEIKK